MLTKKVVFNDTEYNIRNNMRTQRLQQESIKEMGIDDSTTMIVVYAWNLIRGFNLGFNMSWDEFEMLFDDPKHEDFLKSVIEVANDGLEKNKEGEDSEESTEKK